MRQTNFALALLAAAALTACGGSDNNNTSTPPAKPVFASQVTFGDSLSDVGTYKVGTVAAIGGGTYTINGDNTAVNAALHGKNWTQILAAQMSFTGAKAPCPAWTGLNGVAAQGFSVPVVPNTACHSYAMGGARVTAEVGPGHSSVAAIGQLTYPVVKQVGEYLTRNGGKFTGTEIVYVWAGGNDLLWNLGQLTAAATAAGNAAGASKFIDVLSTSLTVNATNPTAAKTAVATAMATALAVPGTTLPALVPVAVGTAATQAGNAAVGNPAVYVPLAQAASAEATTAGTAAANAYAAANGPALVPKMSDAGLELGALIRDQMIAKGAGHVVVLSLPDVATATPTGIAQSASGKQLIAGMVSAFNLGLQVNIDGLSAKVMYVDLFTQSQKQLASPATYGITNATTAACGANPLGTTSLACNIGNVKPGDISHYIFADDVHPAPYGHTLIAKKVSDDLVAKGWL